MANTFIQSYLQAKQIQPKHRCEQVRVNCFAQRWFPTTSSVGFFFSRTQNAEPQLFSPLTALIQFPSGHQCMNTCCMTAKFILWDVVWFSHVHTKVGLLEKSIYVLSHSSSISAAVCRSFSKGYALIKPFSHMYLILKD